MIRQSFLRVVGLFSIVVASGFITGCGGPGKPVPGGSDPAAEAANAALAPEDGTLAAENAKKSSDESAASKAAESEAAASEAAGPTSDDSEAASAPEPES